ncbi:phosphate signaling complex protein PhoU [Gracilibacillus alcaliphilus]|uniref:phosphate signaling complex protein PhoU n=1 Tax=Gracilibacillus alcaliphilus TaxID=1401441 RepID=UPI00195EF918|nr:phosphate signaling complex protein PhoU [Gracilibacillus alcaliphilus]MBM7675019.1 phosphate transport system protein [Gracilibacillus alcaliphilus]
MVARSMFHAEQQHIEKLIIEFANKTKEQLSKAVDCLYKADVAKAKQVIDQDKQLDALDHQINDEAIVLIARQQPVARDLRRLVVALRISTDLERMADNAKNIAKATVHLGSNPRVKPHSAIREMKEIAIEMIDLAMKAYEYEDITLARRLASLDDMIDQFYGTIMKELLEEKATDPEEIQHVMQMAFSGRYVERIGDHATNIGEDVMYLVKGESLDLNE